jgi:cyclohexanecarboxylate-CoA ligase
VNHLAMRDLVNPQERAACYRDTLLWTEDTLASQVVAHAQADAQAVCVVDRSGERQHTYGELADDAAVVADELGALKVRPGDVVSLQMPNRYETVVCAVAIQSLGAVINPLLPDYRTRELTHVFRTARPVAVITPDEYRGCDFPAMIADASEASGVHPIHIVDGPGGGDVDLREVLARPGAGALDRGVGSVSELIFTSGTEATPKAIMHTEENANLAVRTLFTDIGVDPRQVVWMPSPIGHSTGFNYGVRAALITGRTLVLQDRWSASEAIALIHRFGCSYTLAATTFLRDLVEECERTDVRLDQLTHFGCGGAPVPPDLVRRAAAAGITVLRLYGSTEVLCATWNRPGDPMEKRMYTDGRALSHTEIEIRGEDGVPVPSATPGELYVRGPQCSVGFFADPERTAATYLPDGWIRSGDLARVDSEGHLTIVGRQKEIIIRAGLNIAPREIEDLISEFPEVERVAVVGIPDDRLGEQAGAVVVLRPGAALELADLVERLRATGLSTYKLPQFMHVVDDLPTTASGKIQKHKIVQRLVERELGAEEAKK